MISSKQISTSLKLNPACSKHNTTEVKKNYLARFKICSLMLIKFESCKTFEVIFSPAPFSNYQNFKNTLLVQDMVECELVAFCCCLAELVVITHILFELEESCKIFDISMSGSFSCTLLTTFSSSLIYTFFNIGIG